MKNSILVDEPMEMEVVTTVVTSEVLESGELPIITEDKVIEYPTPEVNVIEKNDDNEENEGGGNNTLLILVRVLALAGGGAFYYFKVYKAMPKAPKQSLYDEDEEE